MVTLHHIKQKAMGSNASELIQEFKKVPTCTTDEDEECDTSGATSPVALFLPRFSGTGQYTPLTSCHLDDYQTQNKGKALLQGGTTRLWHRLLLNIKPEPSTWLGSATLKIARGMWQYKEELVVGLDQGPVDASV